jgi:hypothetical protein
MPSGKDCPPCLPRCHHLFDKYNFDNFFTHGHSADERGYKQAEPLIWRNASFKSATYT